jgi:hypothetical protein
MMNLCEVNKGRVCNSNKDESRRVDLFLICKSEIFFDSPNLRVLQEGGGGRWRSRGQEEEDQARFGSQKN